MNEEENIYIKLEIEKDPMTGELIISTRFDPNAPNFSQDENGICWSPTEAERRFLNEAFELMSKRK
ncbi:MAG: hypothetical protein DRN08_02030 [Thermoplasmata archaeon]|nr:MAG: hypothetical protein DRN05_01505 [Thermoplasmata archaeon]RLF36057.1 MAG: hypothetical protein DRN08_02030 [Thermoplasmata archaeon]